MDKKFKFDKYTRFVNCPDEKKDFSYRMEEKEFNEYFIKVFNTFLIPVDFPDEINRAAAFTKKLIYMKQLYIKNVIEKEIQEEIKIQSDKIREEVKLKHSDKINGFDLAIENYKEKIVSN